LYKNVGLKIFLVFATIKSSKRFIFVRNLSVFATTLYLGN